LKTRLSLAPEQLRRTWPHNGLGFETTAQIPPLEGLVGQERAVEALRFGLGMTAPGYNLYVAGPSGTGKTSYTCALVHARAQTRSVPDDWVYVYNFDQPDEPIALPLPPGKAPVFAAQMEELISDVRIAAGRMLSSQEYQARRQEIVQEAQTAIGQVMEELQVTAQEGGFSLTATERGLTPVPMKDGQPLTDEQFAAMSMEDRRAIADQAQPIRQAIASIERRTFAIEKAVQAKLRQLDMLAIGTALKPVVAHLKEGYRTLPRILEWLGRVEEELVGVAVPEDPPIGRAAEEAAVADARGSAAMGRRRVDPLARFKVNTFVCRMEMEGAPVVVETNPTYTNLFGQAEFITTPQSMPIDAVMKIKAGSIHRANGGYLILQAADLLRIPFAWEALKRALSTRQARIEVPGQESRMMPVEIVRPEPIPLDIKVILIGSASIYRLLYAQDEGFRKQFKLRAEFDVVMDANEANLLGYASFISNVCRREGMRHFTADAVARVLEHSHRLAGDQTKLSARFNEVVEVIYEADAWAGLDQSPAVNGEHVRRAVAEQGMRSALPEVRMQEMIQRGTIMVDVDGGTVGQLNGLTVMSLGDFSFGSPSRITARAHMGQKGILHIEREIAMSGQSHSKGVLTLSAFLGDRFAQERPLALSASIAFEQTYVPVDGDSASSTELYALLSALSGVPIDQGIAVTGSVNQRGEIQPIGGANQKIEGFFHVCRTIGLTGRQGVMIPRRNVPNLALAEEVVAAVAAGEFHVWGVDSIEEGIEILTGVSAGERGADGNFPPDSLFGMVDRRLQCMAESLTTWRRGQQGE
jgi:lon-related putative ATP-dependent protease